MQVISHCGEKYQSNLRIYLCIKYELIFMPCHKLRYYSRVDLTFEFNKWDIFGKNIIYWIFTCAGLLYLSRATDMPPTSHSWNSSKPSLVQAIGVAGSNFSSFLFCVNVGGMYTGGLMVECWSVLEKKAEQGQNQTAWRCADYIFP